MTDAPVRTPRLTQVVHLNGINAATGAYLDQPRDVAEVASTLSRKVNARPTLRLRRLSGEVPRPAGEARRSRLSLVGADESNVSARTGWGIVFAEGESEEVKRALAPLIEHRRAQVGESFRELEPYVPGCSWLDWLGVHDAIPGGMDPAKIPYYLMMVGGPDRIPYGFQYLMDVEYAVGRLAFDTPDEYAAYAESVVRYETASSVEQGRWAGFFGTSHKDDGATQGSAQHLVAPLSSEPWDFRTHTLLAEQATKRNLVGLLGGAVEPRSPALLFTATHGAAFPLGNANQRERNGALVCQEWPGVPPGAGPNTIMAGLKREHYFSALDITPETRIHGTIGFHFACFGAGTPQYDNFGQAPDREPQRLAEAPFVARLPQKMLAHPGGGSLAVIGHVDRVWSYSFQTSSAGDQIGPFREAVRRVFGGQSVGRAMKEFNDRYAALCVYLVCLQQKAEAGEHLDPEEHARLLTECNDAQNYVVLGDPAVRLRADELK